MFCVTWTYQTPPSLSKPAIDKLFSDVAGRYLGVSGLVRKYFGYSEDGKQVIGVYLWKDRSAAADFYTPEWLADVTQRWGAAPVKSEWVIPVVAESALNKLVAD
jgi:hypothetical protein